MGWDDLVPGGLSGSRSRPTFGAEVLRTAGVTTPTEANLATETPLGFGFLLNGPQVRIRVAPKAIKRLKGQLRVLTRRSWGVSMEYRIGKINRFTVGWMAYFRLADSERMFRDLDGWLRRRLRQVRWKEWKTTRPSLYLASCYLCWDGLCCDQRVSPGR
jgi:Group II intron, maturase-specific domain